MSWSNSTHAHSKEKNNYLLYTQKPWRTFSFCFLQANRVRYISVPCYLRKRTSHSTKSEMDIKIKKATGAIPDKAAAFFGFVCSSPDALLFFLCTFQRFFFCLIRVRLPTALPLIRASLSLVCHLLWREFLWSGLSRRLWARGHWHSLDRPKERDTRLATLSISDTHSLLRSSNKVTVSENEGRQWWVSTM